MNGDYYGFRDTGFVIRNGVLYRMTRQNGPGHLPRRDDANL